MSQPIWFESSKFPGSSKTPVNLCRNTRCHRTDDSDMQGNGREDFKTLLMMCFHLQSLTKRPDEGLESRHVLNQTVM
jgi:hypothetical protein